MKAMTAGRVGVLLDTAPQGNVLDSLPDGAYITDRGRSIVYWNKAAERITGWSSSDVVGRGCRDNILVHIDKDNHPLCGREYCPLHRCMLTDTASAQPLLVYAQTKGGTRIPVEVTVAPLRNRNGEVVGGIEIFRDMSALHKDIERARIVQSLCMKSPLEPDPRLVIHSCYVPIDLVGGDFFRVERIDADRYAVLVADVMGHGIASALYTMQLRSLWEEHRKLLGKPGQFLAMLNRCLHVLARDDDHFATAIHLVVDAATGSCSYAMAGHDAPLHAAANGTRKSVATRCGPCLGLREQMVFPVHELTLDPQERLLLFTDGATEVSDPRGDDLGRDGLSALLAAARKCAPGLVLAQIEEQLLRHSHCIRLPDDLTMVLIARNRIQE